MKPSNPSCSNWQLWHMPTRKTKDKLMMRMLRSRRRIRQQISKSTPTSWSRTRAWPNSRAPKTRTVKRRSMRTSCESSILKIKIKIRKSVCLRSNSKANHKKSNTMNTRSLSNRKGVTMIFRNRLPIINVDQMSYRISPRLKIDCPTASSTSTMSKTCCKTPKLRKPNQTTTRRRFQLLNSIRTRLVIGIV